MRTCLTWLLLMTCLMAGAQSANKLYEEGKALYDAKKYTQAVAKLIPAAEKGHKKAQYRLGFCYDKSKGVAEDDKKAFYWYEKAAAQGHAKAQYQLGQCYKKGEGTNADMAKALKYYNLAAKQGNADAQLALGKCYLKGKGVVADKEKAKAGCMKAVKNEKGGDEVLEELRKDAAKGDEDAKTILLMVGKRP